MPGAGGTLDRFFHIGERGSTVRIEIVAGLTTWLTMAYILFVNPLILGGVTDRAGTTLPFAQVLSVPALVAQAGQLRTSLLGMTFLNRLESWEVRGDKLMMRGYP